MVEAILAGKDPIFVVSGVNWAWSSNDKCMQLQTVFVQDTKFVPPLRIDVIGTMDLLTDTYYNAVKADIFAHDDSAAYAISTERNSQDEESDVPTPNAIDGGGKRRLTVGGRIVNTSATAGGAADDAGSDPDDFLSASVSSNSESDAESDTESDTESDSESDEDEFDDADNNKKRPANRK